MLLAIEHDAPATVHTERVPVATQKVDALLLQQEGLSGERGARQVEVDLQKKKVKQDKMFTNTHLEILNHFVELCHHTHASGGLPQRSTADC